MNKKVKYTFAGANQDLTKSKHPFQFYYEAGHIKLLTTDTQSTGSVTNEKGNELVIALPTVKIVGLTTPDIIAVDDTTVVLINESVVINVLTNDSFLYPVTVTMITPPTKGTYVINTDNTITYTNTSGIVETDTFIYQIDDTFTTDTATVTLNIEELIINPPIDDELLEPGDTSTPTNYDGQYFRYVLAPCDRTQSFIRIKSRNKVIGNDKYLVLGSGGVGKEGAIAYQDTDLSPTSWTLGASIGPNCP